MSFHRITSLMIALLLIFWGAPLVADQGATDHARTPFSSSPFDRGNDGASPKGIFDNSIFSPDERFIHLRVKQEKKEKVEESVQEVAADEPFQPDMQQELSPREQVIARFGDPKAEPVIAPDDKAPAAFKGFHAAFEAGDNDLAFQYARQYVRHKKKMKSRIQNIMGMTAKAMEVEGVADGEGWTSSPKFDRFEKYVQKALDEEKKLQFERKNDLLIKALPKKLQELAVLPLADATESEKQTDGFNRDQFQRYLRKVVKQSRDGKVVMTLYVTPSGHRDSKTMAKEMSQVMKRYRGRENVTLQLVSVPYNHPDVLSGFRKRTNLREVPFRQLEKDEVAPIEVPKLVITQPSLKKQHEMIGVRRSTFIEEIIRVMNGGVIL